MCVPNTIPNAVEQRPNSHLNKEGTIKAPVIVLPDDKPLLPRLKEKLFTKEDSWNKHKILGFLCLFSHFFRFYQGPGSDMGFATHPEWTIPTVLLHLSLNISSFDFFIPQRRIKDGGRIWPEYRLHALIFLCRSVAGVLFRWYLQRTNLQDSFPYFYEVNLLIILSTMTAADLASYYAGDYRSSSIREAQLPVLAKYMYSLAQFAATAWTLCSRRYAALWYFAFVVQLNPFGMTMVRKNIISHKTNMIIYGLQLAGGHTPFYCYPCLKYEFPGMGPAPFAIVMAVAAWWRMGPWPKMFRPLQNKYLIWIAMYFFWIRIVKPYADQDPYVPGSTTEITWTNWNLQRIQEVLLIGVVVLALAKQFQNNPVDFRATFWKVKSS